MQKFLLLLLTLLCLSCFQTERHCSDFKTGTFQFDYAVDGIEKTGTFVRTETLNIDYYENKVDSASVRWINDCEFIQKKINPKNKSEENAIHFKILSTTKDSYTFEYQLAVKDAFKKKRIEKGTAKKIK
ncbi:hypothetical protein WNY78_07175 [Psychroserpens sp. AS72]|uniref:hypothetical protein n=1 Tax=Psychroserpens sp. AS72 TaxID=3135775 RepID=UPI003181242B